MTDRPKVRAILDEPSLKDVLPKGFLYGSATASYQIEGAIDADGKGPSVWDDCLKDQDNGSVACNSYELWREDLKLLKRYGCDTYRFSIAWSRVKPLGGKNDPVNEAGVRYYSDIIDECLAQGLTPFVTIFHWDHPLELEKRYEGFLSEAVVEDFTAFAELCFERFGDRVKHWATINEPHIFTMQSSMSYKRDVWQPKRDHARFAKSLLLCHAHTVDAYRKKYQTHQKGTIGIVFNCDWIDPADTSSEAQEAAQWGLDWVLGFYADPIFYGRFPDSVLRYLEADVPTFEAGQWALIKDSSEFFGWNHYGTSLASGKRIETNDPRLVSFGSIERVFERDGKVIGNKGDGGHPYDVPWGCRKLIRYIHKRYSGPSNVPIYITECGFNTENENQLSYEDRLHDTQRQDYFAGYLKELCEAVRDDGIDLRGFLAWSLLDNLEWLAGYRKRFGITMVDRENGCKRTPKDSSATLRAIFEHVKSK